MRILLTGYQGYLGSLMAPMLTAAGREVVGFGTDLFADGRRLGRRAPRTHA